MSDNTANQTATLASVIQQAINNRLKDLHTAQPGIIETFDPDTQLATVQPAIKRIFKTVDESDVEFLTPTALPVLINVPVAFPRGNGFSLTFPVKKGDECLIVFNERSIDNWNKNGGVQEPSAFRLHSLSDAMVYVGLSSQPNKITNFASDDVELRNEAGDQRIILKANGDIEIDTPSNNVKVNCTNATVDATAKTTVNTAIAEVNASTKMDVITPLFNVTAAQSIFSGAVNINGLLTWAAGMAGSGGSGAAVTGNVTVSSGDVKADGVGLKSHTHTQGNDSSGDIQQTTNTGAG